MSVAITERELVRLNGKRRVMLEAEVNGEKLWRVWSEGSVSSIEKKRVNLQRDIDMALKL